MYSEVEGKLDVGFEDRGEQQFKNISKPVRAYAVRAGAYSALTKRLTAAPSASRQALHHAVPPFENMSGDPEQEYFADGMVEECRRGTRSGQRRDAIRSSPGRQADLRRVPA